MRYGSRLRGESQADGEKTTKKKKAGLSLYLVLAALLGEDSAGAW